MPISCGIDFGTTNTIAALSQNKENPELVILENDQTTLPSVLFFDVNNNVYFGREALNLYMNGKTGRCMRSLKRVLGTDLMALGTSINNHRESFADILRYFLQNVKNKTDMMAKCNVENVVLGRPVHFKDYDNEADSRAENELRSIAVKIGFRNIEFQYEPVAAAFAHERKMEKEQLACVIDIGGGTSDFTILRVGQKLADKADRKDDILANSGVRIGGNDFDKDLSLKCFMPTFGYGSLQGGKTKYDKIISLPTAPFHMMSEWSSINSMYTYKELNFAKKMLFNAVDQEKVGRFVELIEKELGYLLLNVVENTKIELTTKIKSIIELKFISDEPKFEVNRLNFENSLNWDIKRIFEKIDECVKQAQVKRDDIKLIILTGGSTEIPFIKNLIAKYFPNADLSQENKFSSVGMGLAYDSIRKFL